jgi:hypothetical protein
VKAKALLFKVVRALIGNLVARYFPVGAKTWFKRYEMLHFPIRLFFSVPLDSKVLMQGNNLSS